MQNRRAKFVLRDELGPSLSKSLLVQPCNEVHDLQNDPGDQLPIDGASTPVLLGCLLHDVSRILIFHNVSLNGDVTKWFVPVNTKI